MVEAAKRAVVIGIDRYADDDVKNLSGAANDAKEIQERLEEGGGFESPEVLINEAATDEAIRTAISNLLWEVDPIDLAIIYFSGHGFADSYGNGYLAPHNFEYSKPLVHGIDMAQIQDLARRAKNKSVVLTILDCCYAGISTGKDAAPRAASLEAGLHPIQNEEDFDGRGRFVLASSGPDQQSRERAGQRHTFGGNDEDHVHGVFTFHLLEGLDGGAARDDEEITLHDVETYLRDKIGDADQRLTVSSAGAQGEVRIARPVKYQSLMPQIERINEALSDDRAAGLFWGVTMLKTAAKTAPHHRDVLDLQEQVSRRVQAERGRANGVLLRLRGRAQWESPHVYQDLTSFVDSLDYTQMGRMDDRMMGLVQMVWEVAEEAVELETLAENIRQMESGQREPQRSKTAAGNRPRR